MTFIENNASYKKLIFASERILAAENARDFLRAEVTTDTKKACSYIAAEIRPMLTAIVQLGNAIEDMQTCRQMVSRYPWHGTNIKKSKHLELTWFLFQNLCYKYTEKLKLVYKNQISIAKFLKVQSPAWLQEELKLAKKALVEEIKDRGNSVHSWDAKNRHTYTFELVETLNNFEKRDDALKTRPIATDQKVKDHYSDAKYSMKFRSQTAIDFCEAQFQRVLSEFEPLPIELINAVNSIFDKVDQGAEVYLTR